MTGKDRMVADLKAQHEANRREHEDKRRKERIEAKEPIVDPALFAHLERNRRAAPPPEQPRQSPPPPAQAAPPQGARRKAQAAPPQGARRQAPTPEQARAAAARRAAAEEKRKREKEEKKEHRLALRHAVMGYFTVFVCVLFLIGGITLTLFLIGLNSHDEAAELPDRLVIYTDGEKSSVPYSSAYRNGEYFVDLSALASRAGFTASGDKKSMVFSTPSGEKALFTVDSAVAVINGISVNMDAPCFLSDGALWVSADFADRYLDGVSVTLSEDRTSLTVELEDACSFTLKSEAPLGTPSVDDLPPSVVILPTDTPRYDFASDLSAYYKYMDPEDRDTYLALINSARPVDDTYAPPELARVLNVAKGTELKMSLYAEKALEAMFIEMYAAGYTDVITVSAYRTYEAQKKQFDIYVYNERYYYRYNFEKTGKYFSDEAYDVLGKSYLNEKYVSNGKTVLSADDARRVVISYYDAPGTSDHQTGLGCHLRNRNDKLTEFEQSEAYAWLCENAHKFGFILRYPEGKERITGLEFEPYHWRFVGQYHAAVMYESGMCLEEYVAMLEKGE